MKTRIGHLLSFAVLFTVFMINPFMQVLKAQQRARDLGIKIGIFEPGKYNAITDVASVHVGQVTLIEGSHIRTGVTAVLPDTNVFNYKIPAAVYVGNGFGKLAGSTQVMELGNLETPIILTNTLSVGEAVKAVVNYTLHLEGNETVRSVNAVVGETNDGYLNDIRGMHVKEEHVIQAIEEATNGAVDEGNVGAGTGTSAFGYKGGIGTASRVLPTALGGYTVGVLVQSNFGGVLTVDGVPVGEELGQYSFKRILDNSDGSCMMVVATDAPLSSRNLERLAKRALLGLGRTGGIASNGSGDYVVAFSTYLDNRIPYRFKEAEMDQVDLHNDALSPLFAAVIEATEEAIINSLVAADDMKGRDGNLRKALPITELLKIMEQYKALK